MITAIALALSTALAADTTVPATKGQRLSVDLFAGSVTIRTWTRDAVKVEGELSSRDELEVRTRASTIEVEASGRHGPAMAADLVVTIPAGMGVDVDGVELDVTVEQCRCALHVESVRGDVTASGTEGPVSLSSVEGEVQLTGADGPVQASSVNADVRLRDIAGDVTAESVNGDVRLEKVRASIVAATTVNGDVTLDGEIRKGGRYTLSSHQGDVSLAMPPETGATVRVNTFNGSFESDYPVTLQGEAGRSKRMTFVHNGGGAAIDLESFNGDIRLLKPGARPASSRSGDRDRD